MMEFIPDTVYTAIALAVSAFVIPWLKQKANSERCSADADRANADGSDMENKRALVDFVREFAHEEVVNVMRDQYPKIAERVLNGELKDVEDIRKELHSLGVAVRESVIDSLEGVGFDISGNMDTELLDRIIRKAAHDLSPFQTANIAEELENEHNARLIHRNGVDAARNKLSQYPENRND